jgi:hypothetical protein
MREGDNDHLAFGRPEDDPTLQIYGYSITWRIAAGKQQGGKVFTLQDIVPFAEQGFAAGCAFILPALGYHNKVDNNDLQHLQSQPT